MAKKRLSRQQEFEIMKMVLDKFLWLGTVILGIGMYKVIVNDVENSLGMFIAGVVVLIIFVILLVREYEITR
ncbi:MAG TPA: hypothetical protein VJC16_06120 [Candidatus Nanoarchaeia archaeon]|nr:hypothetical protein [Candidatus Nanoarchaeia archaeon]